MGTSTGTGKRTGIDKVVMVAPMARVLKNSLIIAHDRIYANR
jgi:hypothetical protein